MARVIKYVFIFGSYNKSSFNAEISEYVLQLCQEVSHFLLQNIAK